ncbi:MAG: hypothetical protein WBI82_00215 [Sphaerochaeta sp.]
MKGCPARLSQLAQGALIGEAAMDGIGFLLELQGGALMPFLASCPFLGRSLSSLVDGGRLGFVEEISGGRLAAVAAVLVLLFLELCYPCILCSNDLPEFVDGAGKFFDDLGLGPVLVIDLGELGRLFDSLQDQFLIGRGKTVNLEIEPFKFLLSSIFWCHLNPIST